MDTLVKELSELLPGIKIIPGDSLRWSPKTKEITYPSDIVSDEIIWGVLHEFGHAKLNHTSFNLDVDLLLCEVAAWDESVIVGKKLGYVIDPEHIQDCLDTYRDWLHQRSTCPRCGVVSFQETATLYKCFNCRDSWVVSQSRLCRPYRLNADKVKDRSRTKSQAIFQVKSTD